MSCILRISGTDLSLDELEIIKLVPDSIWQRGTPIISNKPDGKKYASTGARYIVSDADFDEFDIQKNEAIEFLTNNNRIIEEMIKLPSVEYASLDFGIERRDVAVQCDSFQPELLKLAGNLGLGIELSQYPIDEDE
jgi:hypothetical protein